MQRPFIEFFNNGIVSVTEPISILHNNTIFHLTLWCSLLAKAPLTRTLCFGATMAEQIGAVTAVVTCVTVLLAVETDATPTVLEQVTVVTVVGARRCGFCTVGTGLWFKTIFALSPKLAASAIFLG